MKLNRLSDMLLFPGRIFSGLTAGKRTLVAGIVFVGACDILFPYVIEEFNTHFAADSSRVFINAAILLLLIPLTGLLDTVIFGVPAFDLFKVFKKERKHLYEGMLIKVMKIYIMAHIPVIPAEIILYYLFRDTDLTGTSTFVLLGIAILFVLPLFWFAAIISRGVNVLYRFKPFYQRLVFPLVLIWCFIISKSLNYIIMNVALKLLRT